MSNWATVEDLRDIFIRKYTKSELSNELEKACSEEYELMRDYNGRQILELLQNVDDAYGDKKQNGNTTEDEEVVVKITYKGNILEVGNTGTSFSKETIERLCLGRASNKSSQNIGNKGTGFRSLLNDAEWIELYSGDFAIRFSEKYAQGLFEQFIDSTSKKYSLLIAAQNETWKKDYPLCFPTMNCPEQINMIESGFDTLIRVKLKESNSKKGTSVVKQLEQPFYKSLLFLPNITKIVIETDKDKRTSEKIVMDNDVLIERTTNDTSEPTEEYFVFNKKAEIGDKTADLSIAIPKSSDYDFTKEKLYCYFPIRSFSTPIHALINAPFVTNNSRDDVPDDSEEINKKIFEVLLPFIKEVAEDLANPAYADTSIKMATPFASNKLWDSDVFDLKDDYLELLSESKILSTVNDEYISLKNSPKLFVSEFPEEFKGKSFEKLLKLLETPENNKLVQELADYIGYDELEYSAEELSNAINDLTETWDDSTRVKVFLWWSSENYVNANVVPKLLKDNRGNWILKSDKVFLPTDGGISVLSESLSWVKLCVLNQSYVDELISQIKTTRLDGWENLREKYSAERTGDKRLLDAFSESFLAVEFTEQSGSDLIIGTINRQIDSVSKANSFMNWFFNTYQDKLVAGSELSKVSFNLPNDEGEIKTSSQLYLGKNYDNPLGERLFSDTSYSPLIPVEKLYTGNDRQGFISFIERCGISKFPKIDDNANLVKNTLFKNFVAAKYKDEIDFTNINYLKSKAIANFEKLIRELSTAEIVEWIKQDEELNDLLSSKQRTSNARQQSNWNGLDFYSNEYIKFVLNTTSWVEFNEKKYAPQQIVKYDKLKDNVAGIYGVAEQDLLGYLGNDVILNLEFKESMALLKDAEIKNILDTLPSFDKGEISRKLYTEIIKYKREIKPSFSSEGIQVLAKDGKFYPNHSVKYADKKLPKAMESQTHFISIPGKQNTTTINDWFGVERFKTNLTLQSHQKSEYNLDAFKQEIDDIKSAVLSTIDDNKTNVDKLKRMQIIPCTQVVAKDVEQDNQLVNLEDYYFVDDGRDYYLKVPMANTSIEQLRQSDGFSTAIVDIFKQLLTLELDSNLIELLVSKDKARKRDKITDEYGVDKWNDSVELLFSENELNKQVVDYFADNGLDKDFVPSIEEIDFSYVSRDTDYENLILALMDIDKDIIDINELSELLNVDIRGYWQKQFRIYLDTNQEKYRQACYKIAADSDDSLKKKFLEKLNGYKNFNESDFEFQNSVKVNLSEVSEKEFPELKDKVVSKVDIDAKYYQNVDEVIEVAKITQQDFDYYIQSHKATNSFFYFKIPDGVIEDIQNYLYEEEERADNDEKTIISGDETSTVNTKLTASTSLEIPNNNGSRGERSQRDYEKQNSDNENAGKTAEDIAYAELSKSGNYPNLIWHSKYSKRLADRNNLPPKGIVCDMWVNDPVKGNKYFEIKSSISEFEMSINEYESMVEFPDNYEVVLVNRETKEISRHKFDELDALKKPSKYVFRFKQIKE